MTDKIESSPVHRHERTDVDTRYIAAFAAILAAVVLALYVVTWWVFNEFAAHVSQAHVEQPPAPLGNPPLFPAPRLQVDPQRDLEQLRESERELLDSYGWIDRPAGLARIPIDRAIDIVSENGLPDFEKTGEGVKAK
jgi:hypothetical protein